MFARTYREVLALPRVRTTYLLIFLARLLLTAVSVSVTLHVTEERGLGYGAADVLAAWLLGAAFGATRVGRAMDRFGITTVVAVCGLCSAAYRSTAGHQPCTAVLPLGLLAGAVAVPFAALGSQYMAALVPEERRRPALCLDMISTEAAFVLGPTLAILTATRFTPTAALTCIGCGSYWPPPRSPRGSHRGAPRRPTGPLPSARRCAARPDARVRRTLMRAGGSVLALMGMEVTVYASLRAAGHVEWGGIVMAVMPVASIAGGLAYGCLRKPLSHGLLAASMCALLVPVGLLGQSWCLLAAALIPANLLCAPALVARTEAITRAARRAARARRWAATSRRRVASSSRFIRRDDIAPERRRWTVGDADGPQSERKERSEMTVSQELVLALAAEFGAVHARTLSE
ncbi:MFS transporter [Streptomyces sp. NPDC056519]|uniref:MFS transporter n=1 Tax=Streptomyces sp. NPDC056519 TaxID=3345849 RepID=UPI00367D5012